MHVIRCLIHYFVKGKRHPWFSCDLHPLCRFSLYSQLPVHQLWTCFSWIVHMPFSIQGFWCLQSVPCRVYGIVWIFVQYMRHYFLASTYRICHIVLLILYTQFRKIEKQLWRKRVTNRRHIVLSLQTAPANNVQSKPNASQTRCFKNSSFGFIRNTHKLSNIIFNWKIKYSGIMRTFINTK